MNFLRKLRSLLWLVLLSPAAAGPATNPASVQTGETKFTFMQRSPLSSWKQITQRLGITDNDVPGDYDLKTFTFTAYIPSDYDPSVAYGIFVYLGNHDVNTPPKQWEPVLDKSHMIFIAPDWHSPTNELALIGLGFDAVDNLKRLYNIDSHRLYDMWFNSGPLLMPVAGADVYTGMILGEDWDFYRKIDLPGGQYVPAKFPPPPHDLMEKAKQHGVVLISVSNNKHPEGEIMAKAMKQDGFSAVLSIAQSSDELHYPNYAAGWFTVPVLPFLDKNNNAESHAVSKPHAAAGAPSSAAAARASGAAAPAASAAASSSSADAQHLLSMAQLYLSNGSTELARAKLEDVIAKYPKDPAAGTAKKLLDALPPKQ